MARRIEPIFGVRSLTSVLALCAIVLTVEPEALKGAPEARAEPLRVLLISGQSNHRWAQTTPVLEQILEATGRFAVDVSLTPPKGAPAEAWDAWRPAFGDYRAVVSEYNGEPWPEPVRLAFERFVAGGGGFVVVHAGNNAFADWPEYNRMIGVGGWGGRTAASGPRLEWKDGAVVRDDGPGPAGRHGSRHAFVVESRAPDHPILRGLPERWEHSRDELYDNLRGPAENVTVLATAWSDPKTGGTGRHEPMLMAIGYGEGRVFHTTLGHELDGMKSDGFRATLARGTEWAATGVVTLPAPPSLLPAAASTPPPAAAAAAPPRAAAPTPAPPAAADPERLARGEAVYLRAGSCVTCHLANGTGIAGSFPPLAGSDWATGDPGRLVRIVLHGVQGRREIGGTVYNGLMPAQGALLTDAEIADVASYVRQAWGNRAPAVPESLVAQLRSRYDGRVEPWETVALAEIPDAPAKAGEPGLTGLTRRIYRGIWDRLPDFGGLTPLRDEPQPRNKVTVENDVADHDFGLVFTGELRVPGPGAFRFNLTANDGAVLKVGGKEVTRIEGLGPTRNATGTVELEPGTHPFELAYFCARGFPELGLSWAGPGLRGAAMGLSAGRPVSALASERVVRPEGDRPAVYRNPIHNGGGRSIGVAYPAGVNLGFDADRCQVVLAWTGAFLDPTPQWSGRGEGVLQPAGEDVLVLPTLPPFARGVDATNTWPVFKPELGGKGPGYRFAGYSVNAAQGVTFRYAYHGFTVEDVPRPIPGERGQPGMLRTLRIGGSALPGDLLYLAAAGGSIVEEGDAYVVDGFLRVRFPGWSGPKPSIVRTRSSAELRLTPGPSDATGTVEIVQEYRWPRILTTP